MGEKKWRPAHEVAIEAIRANTIDFGTLADFYAKGVKVPTEALPELIEAFREAATGKGWRIPASKEAIEVLKEQLKEATAKTKEERVINVEAERAGGPGE